MRQCFHLRPAEATCQSWPSGKGLPPWQSEVEGPASLHVFSVQPREMTAGDGDLPLVADLTGGDVQHWLSPRRFFGGSQISANQCLLPACKRLHFLCPLCATDVSLPSTGPVLGCARAEESPASFCRSPPGFHRVCRERSEILCHPELQEKSQFQCPCRLV